MKLQRSPAPHPILLFLAPALSLVLVLIFFLMLSSSFMLQPGIAVTVPSSPFILSPQRNPRIITVTGPPLSAIYFENEKLTESALRERLTKLRGRTQTIILKADRQAYFEKISAVTNLALELGYPVVFATTSTPQTGAAAP